MIITCPACSIKYSIDPNALGVAGKTVRCSKCSHKWLQTPVYASAPQPQPVAVQPAPPPPPPPPPPEPEPEPVPEPAPAPVPVPEPEPEPEPAPAPEPEPEPEPEAASEGGQELSQAELDNMFGEESDTPDEASGDTDEGLDEDEDLSDPDFIADSLVTQDNDKPKGGMGKLLGISAVILLLGLGGGLFFGREYIISMYPDAEEYYAMVDFASHKVGVGLEIKDVKSERTIEKQMDVLTVRGTIQNISDVPRPVPLIKVSLYDADGEEIQFLVVKAKKAQLPAGERVRFLARLEDTPITARRLEVTFTEPAEGENPQPPAETAPSEPASQPAPTGGEEKAAP